MRKWRSFDVPADDEWAVYHQIVVPKSYRHEILSIVHESPMSGHLGRNKTYHKIINHFYWPGLKSDVSKYCKTCHTCQMVGKPNQTIPKAQLQPIPAFDEPFSRILIDCVGPLPRTKSGNEYLLTIMCTSTRFPEASPLRNIKTKSIVKALIKFFTFVSLPKSVQSDQGSNFMSGIFQQVMHELRIKQYRSSAYHPESQGALERFHQTLKNMIRSYCFDTEKDWDEGIHLLLFAARESVQEYEHLFPDIPTKTDKIYHDVIVEDSKPIKQHPYRMNPLKQKHLKDEVKYLLENDFIEPVQSNYSSLCILVPKSNGTYRMCTDYRKVNSVTKTDSFPIPRIDDCIDKVGNSEYVTKFDLLKGFWQVPLTDRAKEVSAFATPNGLYQYKVMPFGMKNSPATFQRLVNNVICGLDGCDAYIDDVIVYSDSFKESGSSSIDSVK